MIDIDAALSEYEKTQAIYKELQDVTVPLLRRLLRKSGIHPHSITQRIKTRESLREKLNREGKAYEKLHDVKDIVGIRVITYFEDELETVDHVIKTSFEVDTKNSYDRRSKLNSDQFGYRSIHYVCRYSPARVTMDEYADFVGHDIEIQTRSILQHAWAEIEHDYYKTKGKKPESIERRNSRLAGLLELADDEFVAIRKEMEIYRKNVDLRIDADENLENVRLDAVSIASFIAQDPAVAKLDEEVAMANGQKVGQPQRGTNITVLLRAFGVVGVNSLEEVRNLIRAHSEKLPKFVVNWRAWSNAQGFPSATDSYRQGLSIYHLAIFLAALQGKEALEKTFSMNDQRPTDPIYIKTIEALPRIASGV